MIDLCVGEVREDDDALGELDHHSVVVQGADDGRPDLAGLDPPQEGLSPLRCDLQEPVITGEGDAARVRSTTTTRASSVVPTSDLRSRMRRSSIRDAGTTPGLPRPRPARP